MAESIYTEKVPKAVQALLDPKRTRSGKVYGYRGRRVQNGGATLTAHVITTIILLGGTGVTIGTISYFLGPTLMSLIPSMAPCTAGEQFGALVLGWIDPSQTCAARQAKFDGFIDKVTGIVTGIWGTLTYSSVLAWVERTFECAREAPPATAAASGGASSSGGGGASGPSAGGASASASGARGRKSRKRRHSGGRRKTTRRH